MKHSTPEIPTVCANCGTATTGNFCPQCGQATHLHEETFLGMIGHFIGHYFHYDSKFWKTLKALWFKPGKLSVDYWEGKRARHIPPISLYIFLSAVFFLCYFSFHKSEKGKNSPVKVTSTGVFKSLREKIDAIDSSSNDTAPLFIEAGPQIDSASIAARDEELATIFGAKSKNLTSEKGKELVIESFKHNFPKIFFFMIPVMAGVLRLLFIRRKHCYFVSHAVFSLHIHAFFFSVLLLLVLNPIHAIQGVLGLVLFIIAGIYFVLAVRNAYKVSIGRAILNLSVVGFLYFIFFLIAMVGIFLLSLYTA